MRVWPRQSEDERNERGHLNTTGQAAGIYKLWAEYKVLGANAKLHTCQENNQTMWECSFHSSQSDVSSIIPAARNQKSRTKHSSPKTCSKRFIECVWNVMIGWIRGWCWLIWEYMWRTDWNPEVYIPHERCCVYVCNKYNIYTYFTIPKP